MRKWFVLVIFSLLSLPSMAQAQDTSLCSPSLDFSYDFTTDTLSVIRPDTGEVLNTIADVRNFHTRSTSPNCRYLVGSVWRDNDDPIYSAQGETTIWDAISGNIIATYPDLARIRPHRIHWSPDSQRLIVESRFGAFLWNFFDNTQVQLTTQSQQRWQLNLYWDTGRGEVYILPYSYFISEDAVLVYNWLNGTQIARLDNSINETRFGYTITTYSIKDNLVFVYHAGGDGAHRQNPLTVWDRNTWQIIAQVNTGSNGPYTGELIDISPDGRYLVIGFTTLRVWDLWNLPENFEERSFTYQHLVDNRGMQSVRFIDNVTVEMVLDNLSVQHRNVETGEIVE